VREATERLRRGYGNPDEHQPPRVLLELTNTLREARGGRKIYPDSSAGAQDGDLRLPDEHDCTSLTSSLWRASTRSREPSASIWLLDDKIVDRLPEIKDEWQALAWRKS
jgi:hypothetical protein